MATIKHSTGVIHNYEEYTPYVGMTGIYSVRSPYNTIIKPDIEYTCNALINISGAIANGMDVLNDVYLARNDTEENYKTDFNKNSVLLTLQSSKGDIVIIPNSALTGLPDANGVNYVSVLLGVSISIIPDFLDLTDLQNEINALVFKHLGVSSTIYPTVLGGSLLLSHDKHETLESVRLSNVAQTTNIVIENEQLKQANSAYQTQLTLLQNYIKDNLPP